MINYIIFDKTYTNHWIPDGHLYKNKIYPMLWIESGI